MADIFFPMMPTPDWVRELSHRVLDDASYERHCTIEWRWGDPRPKSWAEPVRGRVVIRAPHDRGHAALASTLLHELAHLVMPPKEHHSRRFWRHFYGLVERYGSGGDCVLSADDAYVLSRHYKVTAIKVAAELGVRAARSDLTERVPGAAQPRRWLVETLALERRLAEQTCEACLQDVLAAPSGARNPTAPAFDLAPSPAMRERAGGEGLRAWLWRSGERAPSPPQTGSRGSESDPLIRRRVRAVEHGSALACLARWPRRRPG